MERVIFINDDDHLNTRATAILEQAYHGRHRPFLFTPPWGQRLSDCMAHQTISSDLPPAEWDSWDDWSDTDDNFIGWAQEWERRLHKK